MLTYMNLPPSTLQEKKEQEEIDSEINLENRVKSYISQVNIKFFNAIDGNLNIPGVIH